MTFVDEIKYSGDLKSDLREFIVRQAPAIVRGAAADWPAVRRWSNPDYLIEKLGDLKVQYKKSSGRYFPDPASLRDPDKFSITESSLRQYMEKVLSDKEDPGGNYFLSGNELSIYKSGSHNKNLRPIFKDFSLPNCFDSSDLDEIGVWLTGEGNASCLHYDRNGCGNINVQVSGEKKFVIINPNQFDKLYMFSSTEPNPFFNFSKVIPGETNLDEYPEFKKVVSQQGELGPGDCLYIPPLWVHQFDHVGKFNANLTFWWRSEYLPLNKLSLSWALGTALMKLAWNKTKNLSSQEFEMTDLHRGVGELGSAIETLGKVENIFGSWGD